MRRFWDERAAEDPFFFVDNRLRYGDPDEAGFWASGTAILEDFEEALDFRVRRQDVIVEIGCGIGRVTRALAARAERVLAVDVSPAMLERARDLNPQLTNVDWILGDGTSLAPVPDGGADGCFSVVVFQHLPDPQMTLGYVREMGRVLRPGGWTAFQVSTRPKVDWRPSLPTRLRIALRARLGRGPRGLSHPAWVGSTLNEDALRSTAEASGLAVQRLIGAGSMYSAMLATKAQTAGRARTA